MALDALAGLGVRVPDEVAVTGFDGILAGRLSTPTLTSVRQPMEAMGRAAARILAGTAGALPEGTPASTRCSRRGSCCGAAADVDRPCRRAVRFLWMPPEPLILGLVSEPVGDARRMTTQAATRSTFIAAVPRVGIRSRRPSGGCSRSASSGRRACSSSRCGSPVAPCRTCGRWMPTP
jgi:hypothetical protein